MAATTSLLGLVTPTQGDLSGTWGNTVNNGITEYVDISVAGTLTLTNDGAVTLANTLGSASASLIVSTLTGAGTVTAQFAIVRVTGTLTVAKVVTGPSYSKTYTVVNAATGGIVTFKASGQTGVSVAVGESAFVYYNGTDYVKVSGTVAVASFQTSLGGLTPSTATTGVVTLAGTLDTTSGGTGLTSFTAGDVPYYASGSVLSKLAIGTAGQFLTSTGTAPQWSTLSGVAVTTFSAGTTGFTPSSATSGVVTLAGTLATTNGGTGLTSFTSGGVVYASSGSALATGSALTFDGTNILTTGSILLGGVSSTGTAGEIGLGNAKAIRFRNAANSAFLNAMYVDASNNLQLGAGTFDAIFSVTGLGEAMRIVSTTGNVGIGTSSPALGGGRAYSKVLTIDGGTNTGIENTGALEVGSSTNVNDRLVGGITFFNRDNSGSGGSTRQQVGLIEAKCVTSNSNVNDDSGGTLVFLTKAEAGFVTEKMRLDSTGNLLVGTTSATANYNVVATQSVDGAAGMMVENTSNTVSASAVIRYKNSDAALTTYTGMGSPTRASYAGLGANVLSMYTNSTAGMSLSVDAAGPIKFVTNSTERLSIASTGAFGLSGANYGTNGQVLTSAGSGSAPTWTTSASSQWTTTGANIYFNTGNVGIGTTTPAAKLEIKGANNEKFILNADLDSNSYQNQISFQNAGTNYASIRAGKDGSNVSLGLKFDTSGSERMCISTTGNVGINTTTPTLGVFQVAGYATSNSDPSACAYIKKTYSGYPGQSNAGFGLYVVCEGYNSSIPTESPSPITGIYAESGQGLGYGNCAVRANSTGATYQDSYGVYATAAKATGNSSSYGIYSKATNVNGIAYVFGGYFYATGPCTSTGKNFGLIGDVNNDGATNIPLEARYVGAAVFYVQANGGIANYSANNTNLSDQNEKKNIALAGNYLDKICAIPVKTYLYIQDKDDEQVNLGVIAQDVELVAPEFVTETEWVVGSETVDGATTSTSKTRKSIYQTDIMFAIMKSVQELNAKHEALKAEFDAYKASHP